MAHAEILSDDIKARLGTVPDQEIACELGISRATVVRCRQTLGIAPFQKRGRHAKYWTIERDALLGTMSDGEVVKLLNVPGLNRDRVSQRRRSLGIPAFNAPRCDAALIPIDGDKIRERRESFGKTRSGLATQNPSLAAHLRLMENGQQKAVRPATLVKLCEMLDCDLPECDIVRCEKPTESDC